MIEDKIFDLSLSYIEWQKEFVKGRQLTYLSPVNGDIVEKEKKYYWQSWNVFNLIKPTVDRWCEEYPNELIWGKGNAVDQLIPYQDEYNILMNQIRELSMRLTYPVIIVEDGSVDLDELGEEGLAPGKLLLYRQGGVQPSQIAPSSSDITALYAVASSIKAELVKLMEDLEENF